MERPGPLDETEVLLDRAPGGMSHSLPQRDALEHCDQALGQPLGLAGGYEVTGPPIFQDLRHAANRRGHRRPAVGKRLEEDVRNAFGVRADREHIGQTV